MTSSTATAVRQRAEAHLRALVGPRDGQGDATLREVQWSAIEALAVDRRRALVVQRTGWGKSAVYFVATLLLREEGLASCPQEAWAVYSKQIREMVAIPDDHTFFCGLAIGWGDREAPVNRFPVARAPLEEAVRWEGWD